MEITLRLWKELRAPHNTQIGIIPVEGKVHCTFTNIIFSVKRFIVKKILPT